MNGANISGDYEGKETILKEKNSKGLRVGTLPWWKAAGNGLAMNGPAATVAFYLTSLALLAGGSFPLVIVLSFIVYLGMMYIGYQWSQIHISAYGWLGFQRKGYNSPLAAFMGGWFYYTFYFATTAGFGMLGFATFAYYIDPSLATAYPWLWIPIAIAVVVIDMVVVLEGIRPSVNYMVYTAFAEVAFVIVASIIVIIKAGAQNTIAPFTLGPVHNSISIILVSSILGFTTFGGLSSSVPIGEETANPKKNVPKSMLFSTVMVGATLIIASYAQAIGWGFSNIANYGSSPDPGLIVFGNFLGPVGFALFAILVLNSFNSDVVSNLTNTSRMTFGVSRDGVLPKYFSKVSSKRVPIWGIMVGGIGALTLGIVVGEILGPFIGSVFIVVGYSFFVYFEHIMGAIGLTLYHRRMKNLKVVRHLIIPLIVAAVLIVAIIYAVYPAPAYPLNYLWVIALAWTIIGVIVYFILKKRHPEGMEKLGEYSVE
jgi:amino acid transporter